MMKFEEMWKEKNIFCGMQEHMQSMNERTDRMEYKQSSEAVFSNYCPQLNDHEDHDH